MRKAKKWMLVGATIICVLFIIIHLSIARTGSDKPEKDADYLVVLGARLNGEIMSPSLLKRMETAFFYLEANPRTRVIVSGGQGEGETIPEAEAMARYLLKNGINEMRIVKEDRSTSTFENLAFSQDLLEDDQKKIVIVSNDFHLYRAGLIAKRLGFEPQYLAAPTPKIVKTKLWLREYVAVVKTLLFDW